MIRFWVSLFLFVFFTNTLSALDQPQTPKVLLSGESESSLSDQLSVTQVVKPKAEVNIQPVSQLLTKPSDLFVNQVSTLNNDINVLFKKVTSKLSSLPDNEIAALYLEIKSAQQRNILLEQQNQIMDEIALLNANMQILIKQNNELLNKKH